MADSVDEASKSAKKSTKNAAKQTPNKASEKVADPSVDEAKLKNIIEGALLAAGTPLSLERFQGLFLEGAEPERDLLRRLLAELQAEYKDRAMELVEVATGWRIQVRSSVATWVSRLWEEKPQKYSRALLETLSLIAYKQPITRGEIEDVRGVAVSSSIVKTLLEREWIRVVGHREVPGRPALYATTKIFLDYFNLRSLEDLPPLQDVRDFETLQVELELENSHAQATEQEDQQPTSDGETPARAPAAGGADADEREGDNSESAEPRLGDGFGEASEPEQPTDDGDRITPGNEPTA